MSRNDNYDDTPREPQFNETAATIKYMAKETGSGALKGAVIGGAGMAAAAGAALAFGAVALGPIGLGLAAAGVYTGAGAAALGTAATTGALWGGGIFGGFKLASSALNASSAVAEEKEQAIEEADRKQIRKMRHQELLARQEQNRISLAQQHEALGAGPGNLPNVGRGNDLQIG